MPEIPEETPTIPLNQPGMPVISNKTGNPGKDPSNAIGDYIKPSLIRYPMYDYQTGKQWFLSKTEQIVVDAYLKVNNDAEACRALNAIRFAHGGQKLYSPGAVSRWLRKPHVAKYIAEKQLASGKVNWFKEPDWLAWGRDIMENKRIAGPTQVSVWKEYGKSQGWYKETGPSVQNNTQINFVQSDGKA